MRRNLVPAMIFAATLAACSGAPEMDEAMKRDLEAASAGSIELAPNGPALKTVSAIEQNQPTAPKVAPVRRVEAPAQTPPRAPQPTQQAGTNEPAATAPVSAPKVQPPPPGGYKSVNEVIRNAPFPIKPVRSKEAGAKRP